MVVTSIPVTRVALLADRQGNMVTVTYRYRRHYPKQ